MEERLKDLAEIETTLLDCVDLTYKNDRVITLRCTIYAALEQLEQLRKSMYVEAVQIERDRLETEKIIEELTLEKRAAR